MQNSQNLHIKQGKANVCNKECKDTKSKICKQAKQQQLNFHNSQGLQDPIIKIQIDSEVNNSKEIKKSSKNPIAELVMLTRQIHLLKIQIQIKRPILLFLSNLL